jgi:membrane protease YdiL (CAAX protease family)
MNQHDQIANSESTDAQELRPISASHPVLEHPHVVNGEAIPGGPDPDQSRWGAGTGIAVWLISIGAVFVFGFVAVIFIIIPAMSRGVDMKNAEQVAAILSTPNALFVQLVSELFAHAVTVVICWAVVTRIGKTPFLRALGWGWAGRSGWYWLLISAGVVLFVFAATQLLVRVLPEAENTPFEMLLKAGTRVRVALALMATFSAPFVEELVYRGVLYAGLRKSLGLKPAVVLVTILFVAVHVVQYQGAWASIASLAILSFILTVVRARTGSILPCILIHFLFNAVQSVAILTAHD